ncbi:MAG: AEC family transporter [Clostridiales bacterium]|nr:AEC family transporter [Clostridiales bacterium]
MENLQFALNVTMPIFLTMLCGVLFRSLGLIDETFAKRMNSFVFKITLPLNLFSQLYPLDFIAIWDGRFVGFCFLATALSIGLATFLSRLVDPDIRGEFIQGAYRSSASLFGMAFIQNMYANAAMGGLMIVGSVPLYNLAAVVILILTRPGAAAEERRISTATVGRTLRGIATNPLILGIVVGCVWSLLRIPLHPILEKTVKNVASLTTPMGLLSMGALLDVKKIRGRIRPAVFATLLKVFGLALIFSPVAAYLFGFRDEKLVAILVMLASATTVSSYPMVLNMGHEGTLTQAIVMLTTLTSAFTLTLFIWFYRSLGML